MSKSKTLRKLVDEIKSDYQYFYDGFTDSEAEKSIAQIELVKLDDFMTSEQIVAFMNKQGFRMATFHELAQYIKDNPKVWDEKRYLLTLRDQNEYLAFGRWDGERRVYCVRRDGEFLVDFWVCGVRESSLPPFEDSVQFSNFAQRVKVKYWGKYPNAKVPEIYLDDILLLCWEEFKKFPQRKE